MLQRRVRCTPRRDRKARALREQRIEADRLLLATQSALETDADCSTPTSRAAFEAAMRRLRACSRDSGFRQPNGGGYRETLEQATADPSTLTEPFAAPRMDRAVQRALQGRRIDEVGEDCR